MKTVTFFTAALAFAVLNYAYIGMPAKPGLHVTDFHTPKPAPPADTNITMYGRGLYPGDDSVFYHLRVSGFTTVVQFGAMLNRLKMHMSLCPFTNLKYWTAVLDGSKKGLIDAIYLQCYDGGSRNTPDKWVDSLASDIPLYPIFLCRGSFSSCSRSAGMPYESSN